MSIQTGENEEGLRKIMDMTRLISIALLVLHLYYYFYAAFKQWQLTSRITDRLLYNIAHTGLFNSFYKSKVLALAFLGISLLGAKGRKELKAGWKEALTYMLLGLLLYFGSYVIVYLSLETRALTITYTSITAVGFLLVLSGGTQLTRIIKQRLSPDVFNTLNETFPQEERLIQNAYAINLRAQYNLKGKLRKSWINIINPFRALLIIGSPGSGKSYFIVQQVIRQHLEKGFALFVYDFKWDDLTRFTYNLYLQGQKGYKVKPQFYFINFDDLSKTHRCNPLHPESMQDITDATEAARTILLSLNREWIKRQGDFFVESAINFLTALIWFFSQV